MGSIFGGDWFLEGTVLKGDCFWRGLFGRGTVFGGMFSWLWVCSLQKLPLWAPYIIPPQIYTTIRD